MDFLAVGGQIRPGYDRVIRSRLEKKVQLFMKQELPWLVENGSVTEFRNVTKDCNPLNEPDYFSQLLPLVIFYAPWSDKEQVSHKSIATINKLISKLPARR